MTLNEWEAAKNAELRSSIRRQAGDGDVNLADVWPMITRVGPRAGSAIYMIELRETPAGEAKLRRVRGTVGARGRHCQSCMEMGGACGWHRQKRAGCTARTRSTRVWTALFQRTWHRQEATPGRVRVAPLKLDRPFVRVLPVHNDGGVSRYQS